MWSTAESLWMLYDAGRWDEALERAARAIEWATQHEDSQVGTVGLTYSARILAHRGELDDGGSARRALPGHGSADRRSPDPVAGPRHRRRHRLDARRRVGRRSSTSTSSMTRRGTDRRSTASSSCRRRSASAASTVTSSWPRRSPARDPSSWSGRRTRCRASGRCSPRCAETTSDAASMFREAADGWASLGRSVRASTCVGRGRAMPLGARLGRTTRERARRRRRRSSPSSASRSRRAEEAGDRAAGRSRRDVRRRHGHAVPAGEGRCHRPVPAPAPRPTRSRSW